MWLSYARWWYEAGHALPCHDNTADGDNADEDVHEGHVRLSEIFLQKSTCTNHIVCHEDRAEGDNADEDSDTSTSSSHSLRFSQSLSPTGSATTTVATTNNASSTPYNITPNTGC